MIILNLPGPTFLLVFGISVTAVCFWLWRAIESQESATQPPGNSRIRDPYEIAYLRGGVDELVKVAVLALVRREQLTVSGDSIKCRSDASPVSAPIEKAILSECRSATTATNLSLSTTVQLAADEVRRLLVARGLLPSEEMRAQRRTKGLLAAAILIGFALTKGIYAYQHGHRNLGFLFVFALIALAVISKIVLRSRTHAGNDALAHLKSLFARVRKVPNTAQSDLHVEALLLAAVYGEYTAPGMTTATWRKLFPAPSSGDSGSSSGCGGGGGSGCGGGGGCGGCGS